MTSLAKLSRIELGALITQSLKVKGIDVVLTGGSCASIYSSEVFVSFDLDFIDVSYSTKSRITEAMGSIGFIPKQGNDRYYEHPDVMLTVEFPSAPLMIGDQVIRPADVGEIETTVGVLRLLCPTDCVKDRLANHIYHRDAQCYEQALEVARQHPIDWGALKRWLDDEGESAMYQQFREKI